MNTLVFCNHCQKLNRVPNEKALSAQAICGNCKNELPFHHGVQDVSDIGLKKIITNSDSLVVVDFWAEWCGPCKAFAPTFTAIAKELLGRATLIKANTETCVVSAQTYQIRSIPTLVLFKKGIEIGRQSGALSSSELKQFLLSKI
jgi:thioredoxin 2